ncbi:MAG: hypothetical protein PHR53_06825, partial [Bacteroidales bacterium]|nr:hypothetical protein [Bacteroidales bacterium]
RFWDKGCNARGYFNICAYTPRPVNDECDNAIPLDAPMGDNCTFQNFTNYGATNAAGIPGPGCGNYQGGDIWFTVPAVAGKRLVITTQFGDIFNGGLALYSGDCTSLNLLQCTGTTGGGMPEISMQGFAEDQTLYVRFWSIGNIEQGSFGICAYTTEEQGFIMGTDRIVNSDCSESNPLIITDDGGVANNYGQNRNDTMTIYSGVESSSAIVLNIIDFDVDSTDTLFVYNGETADPALLLFQLGPNLQSWLNNGNSPNFGAMGMTSITAFLPGDLTGAITLRFKTGNAGSGGAGFRMKIYCSTPCQPVVMNTDWMDEMITPTPVLGEDGFKYIDVCPESSNNPSNSITFYGACLYNANDYSYHQSDSTSIFTWKMEDTTFVGSGLTEKSFNFTEGVGSTVSVWAVDERGCRSSNVGVYRIRVSANPIISVSIPGICGGEVHQIGVGYSELSNIVVGAIGSGEATSLTVSDTIFLPDGIPCEPMGCSYQSPVTFTAFRPTAQIRTSEDIRYLRINMEHSFAADILIKLTCPNGQSSTIMKFNGSNNAQCQIADADKHWQTGSNASGGTYFGEAADHEGSDDCNPNASGNEQGIGWNYCWSNNTTQGYTYAGGEGSLIYRSVNAHNNKFDSTNVAEMTQVYHPDDSFDNLIGCPMNGTWYIEVQDGYSVDNGYLFEWELALSPDLLPESWEYEVKTVGMEINGSWVNSINDTTLTINPPASEITQFSLFPYTFTIIDEFGCRYDTTIDVEFYPSYNLTYEDEICHGVPYDNYGFFIANPPVSSTGGDTTIYLSKFDLQTVEFGCDSSLNLALTIHPNKETFFEGSICIGETYNANGFNVTGYAAGEWIYRNVDVTAYGCDTISTLYLNVVPEPETEIVGVTNLCLGASTTLTALGGDAQATYLWNTGATTASITVTPLENTEYSVVISNAAGCSKEDAVTVYVSNYPLPDVHIEGELSIQCGSSTILEAVDNNNVAASYQWSENGEVIEGATNATITVSPTTASVYSVVVTSEYNCTGMTEATVQVTANELGIEASDMEILYSDSTILTAINITGVPSTYVWTWGDNTATGESIVVYPEEETTYYLQATTLDGNCVSVAEITIQVIHVFAPPQDVDPEFFFDGVDESCQAIVYWTAPDPELVAAGGTFIGYNVYRDDELLNDEPLSYDSLLDVQLPEGVYTYCVNCVYASGVSEKVCASIDFNAEYHAPYTLLSTRTEDCNATLYWDSPEKNCWAQLEGYYIYRDGVLIDSTIANGTLDTIYTDEMIGEEQHQYCVKAYYKDANDKIHLSDSLCKFVNTCYHVAVNVYPNPANSEITIIANKMERVMLYDAEGRFIRQFDIPDKFCRTLVVPTQQLPDGAYIFNIFMSDGVSSVKRFIIRH